MKKTIRTLGKIALVMIIAFSFASCFNILDDLFKDDSKDGGGGGGGGSGSGLTITGLPSGQWFVFVFAEGTNISNYDPLSFLSNNNKEATGGNSGDFFPLVKVKAGGPTGPEDIWKGSGSRPVAITKDSATYYKATVSFSNGNATVPYSSFK